MDVYRTEEEQVAALQRWWQENGLQVVAGVLIALGALGGWKWYQHKDTTHRVEASALYDALLDTMQTVGEQGNAEESNTRFRALALQLTDEYGDTSYGQFARLMLARQAADNGDYASAEQQLRDALAHAGDPALEVIVANRLARVVSAQGRHDEALTLLAGDVAAALVAGREETRGDILVAAGRRDEARAAYLKAMGATDAAGGTRPLLSMKLDYVGGQ
jgi:predicted negative regulator of RcsB-dependent stress response